MIACLRPLSALILAGLLTACATSSIPDWANFPVRRMPASSSCCNRPARASPRKRRCCALGSGPCLPAEGPRQVHRHPGTDSAGKPEAGPAGLRQHPERRTGPRPQQAQGRPAGIAASEHAASQRTAGDPAGSYPARQGPGPAADGQVLAAAKERIYFAPLLEGPAVIENQEKIWTLVSSLPVDQLQPSANEDDLSGWLTLARITKTSPTLQQQQASIELATAEPRAPGGQALAGGAGETQDAVPAAADPHRPPATPAGAVGQRRPGPAGRLPRRPLPGPAGRPESSFDQALRQYPGALAR